MHRSFLRGPRVPIAGSGKAAVHLRREGEGIERMGGERARVLGAEFVGTFALVFAGTGAVIVNAVTGGTVSHVGIGLTFGLVIMTMIYATGHISGAHFNPAVTLGFAVGRHFPWPLVPQYWAAQLLGGLAASLLLRVLFGDVASLGVTLPSGSQTQSFILEIVLTLILMVVITAVATDTRAVGSAAAIAIGGTIGLEALWAGPISGASMNPARSLAPAIASWTWDAQWLYVLGPAIGAAIGVLVYQFIRGEHAGADLDR
jgi:MIP family channel proteins